MKTNEVTLYLHNKPENRLETRGDRTEICICKDFIIHQKVAWPKCDHVPCFVFRCLYFINNKDHFNLIILFPLKALKALLWPVMTALKKIWTILFTKLDLKEEFMRKWQYIPSVLKLRIQVLIMKLKSRNYDILSHKFGQKKNLNYERSHTFWHKSQNCQKVKTDTLTHNYEIKIKLRHLARIYIKSGKCQKKSKLWCTKSLL